MYYIHFTAIKDYLRVLKMDIHDDRKSTSDINQLWIPRVSVIGPGGAKGMKILGFLSCIEYNGFLKYVDTYCGVSVGAIISLLIICGYEIREIIGQAIKLDLFKEIDSLNFESIIENKGLISNEPLRKKLTQLVIDKFGNVPTLYNLYMMTGISYVSVTLNATDEECCMMGPFNYPNVSCVDATMFSINIPFIFYQLIYQGKTYVDGALGNPYPVDYFDDGETNILGIYVKTCNNNNTPVVLPHLPGMIVQKIEEQPKSLPMGLYSFKIIHSPMDQRRNSIIHKSSSRCRHICLETRNVNTFGYKLAEDNKVHMLVEGYNDAREFLHQIRTDTYKIPKIPPLAKYTYPPYYAMGETSDQETSIHNEEVAILSAMTNN